MVGFYRKKHPRMATDCDKDTMKWGLSSGILESWVLILISKARRVNR